MFRIQGLFILPLLVLSFFGCATIKSGAGAPILRVEEANGKIQGRWVDPQKDPLDAFDKIERGKSTLADLISVGFDPDAKIVGGTPKDKSEKKAADAAVVAKPMKIEGPSAYQLYHQMLFPEGGSSQTITDELREKRQAEVGTYTAYIFVLDNVQTKKDRVWFSTQNKLKIGYHYEFTFILKNGVVIEKNKKEENFNDRSKESAFGKGAIEALQDVRKLVPIPMW